MAFSSIYNMIMPPVTSPYYNPPTMCSNPELKEMLSLTLASYKCNDI